MFVRYPLVRSALTVAALAGSASLAQSASVPSPTESQAEFARFARVLAQASGPFRQLPAPDGAGFAPYLEARTRSRAQLPTAAAIPNEVNAGAWQPGFGLPSLNEYPSVAIEFRGELVISGWLR